MTSQKKILLYARVSSREQEARGDSLTSQHKRLRKYGRGAGYTPSNRVQLQGTTSGSRIATAKTKDGKLKWLRPELRELFRMLSPSRGETESEFDAVAVTSASRLSRNPRDAQFLGEFFTRHGIELHVLDQPDMHSISTKEGMDQLVALSRQAQIESRRSKKRAAKGRALFLERGGQLGAAPFGQRYSKKRTGVLIESKREMRAVRHILKLHDKGHSFRAIAKILNDEEWPTKRGGSWYHSSVRSVLERAGALLDDGDGD